MAKQGPIQIPFPIMGVNKGRAVYQQPFATSPEMLNVRPRDVLDGRMRGGQRPGLDKWGDGDLIGANNQPVVAMCTVSSII
jgi:hypothetical protein